MGGNGDNSLKYYRSRFGDTTLTKVFVGGLAWETPAEVLRQYFEKFGEILEAVIITEKNTGRSKGYGFVTFRDPDSARRSVMDQNPLIDGRRANCNIAALGHSRSSTQRGRNQEAGRSYLAPPQSTGQPYARVPQFIYPTPYGYITYASEYGYQQGSYHPQLASQYYHQMAYGSHVQSNGGASTYPYHQHPLMNYMFQSSRAGFAPSMMQAHAHYQPNEKDQTAGMDIEGPFFPQSSLPRGFKLQPPPHAKKSLVISDSEAPKPSLTGGNNESSDV
ncbi:RNA-binding protein 38-like [Phalaenopsis equestris]|uniref:RNA-binding protein 38-like n=1 Tax=Phalaenopsis equestris TaxID=78828 RepID=UPI0009E2407B|nr:RNA-binding protein 38-like [Phalaenopsis equestris]